MLVKFKWEKSLYAGIGNAKVGKARINPMSILFKGQKASMKVVIKDKDGIPCKANTPFKLSREHASNN